MKTSFWHRFINLQRYGELVSSSYQLAKRTESFYLVLPEKFQSVGDGKITTKKVRVELSRSEILSFNVNFHFLEGILSSSILFGVGKKTPCSSTYLSLWEPAANLIVNRLGAPQLRSEQ